MNTILPFDSRRNRIDAAVFSWCNAGKNRSKQPCVPVSGIRRKKVQQQQKKRIKRKNMSGHVKNLFFLPKNVCNIIHMNLEKCMK